MIERIVIAILTHLATFLTSKALEKVDRKRSQTASDEEVDKRLAEVKAAYKEAFNGQPVTPEQRKKLHESISNFIRGPGGL